MWIDISRGMAVLRSAWSVASTDLAVDTTATGDAPVPGDFLADAQSYMTMGRHQSAAILAGDAIADMLRELCLRHSVTVAHKTGIDGMNTALSQKGVYDDAVGQRLIEAASLCDKANCGQWSEFSKGDVELMLGELRAFAMNHLDN